MELKIYSFYLLTFWLFIGCATNTYRIQSTPPEASVDFVLKNGTRKNLGKTPVAVSANDVNPNHEPFQIEIQKEGFEKQVLFVPESYFSKNIDAQVTLPATPEMANAHKEEAILNEVASTVADIQKDIQTKSYDTALAKLNRMVAQYPSVSTFYSLSGNVHYLEKRLDRALIAYRKALNLNPSSTELQRIIEKLESVSGGAK